MAAPTITAASLRAARLESSGISSPTAPDLQFYGAAKLTASSAITIPARARRELGFEGAPHVFVFGSPSSRHAILATGPDAPDLLRLLDEWKNRENAGEAG